LSIESTSAATILSPCPANSTIEVCSRKYCRKGTPDALYSGNASAATRSSSEKRGPCSAWDASRVIGPRDASSVLLSAGVIFPTMTGSDTIFANSNSSTASLPTSLNSPVPGTSISSRSRCTTTPVATNRCLILLAFRESASTSRMLGAGCPSLEGSSIMEISSAAAWLSVAPRDTAFEDAVIPAVIGSFSSCSSRAMLSSATGTSTRTMIGRCIFSTAARSILNFSAASTIVCLNRAAFSPPS